MQIIRDHLLRVVLEGEETHVTEDRLECRSSDMRPVQHPIELGSIDHVALQGGQEDLRGVREDDDPEGDGKFAHVNAPPDTAPAPFGDLEEAVGHNDRVNHQVSHGAPEGQYGDTLQRLEETEWQQKDSREHHPGAAELIKLISKYKFRSRYHSPLIQCTFREGASQQIPANDDV